MKSIGERAHEFRISRGWSLTLMAQEVSRHHAAPVSRQVITQLEKAGDRRPHYLHALALTMGISADDLLSGSATSTEVKPAPAPQRELELEPEPTELETALTPDVAIKSLKNWLSTMDASAQGQAATLLKNMAREPAGPWSEWLVNLFTKNASESSKMQQIDKVVSKKDQKTEFTDYSLDSSPEKTSPKAPFSVVTPKKIASALPSGPNYGLGETDPAPIKTPHADRHEVKRIPKSRDSGAA
jgi:transcriptional regulator with XRE-family HTH domain